MAINEKLKATTLNVATLLSSLSLIGISTACLYLTTRLSKVIEQQWPAGDYVHKYGVWQGPELPTREVRHYDHLQYDTTNESMILAGATLGLTVGIVGLFGTFFTWKTPKNTHVAKSTLYFLVVPGTVGLIGTLISFILTCIIRNTGNRGLCFWGEAESTGDNRFRCTHELAVCRIVQNYDRKESHLGQSDFQQTFWKLCPQTETARHLVSGLPAVLLLIIGAGLAKMVLARKGKTAYVETADDRVERLQREEQ